MSSSVSVNFNNCNFYGNLSDFEMACAQTLADLSNPSASPVLSGSPSYRASKNHDQTTKMTANLFTQFYPRGTKVNYQKQPYKIAGQIKEDNTIVIQNNAFKKFRVHVADLKPILGNLALAQDTNDPYKRHAVLQIQSKDRGHVKGLWKDFADGTFNTRIQASDALYRLIPIDSVASLADVSQEVISCQMSDGQVVQGTVYKV